MKSLLKKITASLLALATLSLGPNTSEAGDIRMATTRPSVKFYGSKVANTGAINNDILEQTIATHDGGFLLVGNADEHSVSGFWINTLYLIKVDHEGRVEWSEILDMNGPCSMTSGTIREGDALNVIQTDNNDYLISTGISNDFNVEVPFLVRLNSQGQILWQKKFTQTLNPPLKPWNHFKDIVQVKNSVGQNDGFLLSGQLNDFDKNQFEILLVKVSETGNVEWSSALNSITSLPDLANSRLRSLVATSDHGYLLHLQAAHPIVIKLELNNGAPQVQWQKEFHSPHGQLIGKTLLSVGKQEFMIIGSLTKPSPANKPDSNAWTMVIDESGNIQREMSYSFPYSTMLHGGQRTSDSGFVFTGYVDHNPGMEEYFGEDTLLLKVNKDGSVQWSKSYSLTSDFWGTNLTDKGFFVKEMRDGRFVVSGLAKDSKYGWDYMMMSTDRNGRLASSNIKTTEMQVSLQTTNPGSIIAKNPAQRPLPPLSLIESDTALARMPKEPTLIKK